MIDFAEVRRQALWVVAVQAGWALAAGATAWLLWGRLAGVSAFAGAAIGAIATLVQVLTGLRNSAGRTPQQVVRAFYRGSALKLAATVVLFVLALRGRSMLPAPLFVSYVVSFFVYWLALARRIAPRLAAALDVKATGSDRD